MVGGTCRGAAVFFRCFFSGGRPDTWADTTTPHGRLMLTVLGGLAEFERELIRARTGEELSLLARESNQNKPRAGFGTYNHNTLCIISALVSCGWWAAPAGARLFFRCIFSGGRAVRIGPISLPFVSCGWWAAPA